MTTLERLKVRLPNAEAAILEELLITATDRIKLKLGVEDFPLLLNSLLVEITVKMFRRIYYEGISSESADTLKVSFFEDIFAEYQDDIAGYKKLIDEREGSNKLKVRFI